MIRLLLSIVLAASLVACSSCSWLQSEAKEVRGDIVDCTTAGAIALAHQFGPLAEEVITQATSDDGKVDWTRVKETAKSLAKDTGACVIASVVARALTPRPATALGVPQSQSLELDRAALRAGWDELAAELYGGMKYKTQHGLL